MGLQRNFDYTLQYKQNVYSITIDVSGWDKANVHAVAPIAAPIYVYGSNNSGAVQGVTYGNAELAIDFYPVQATNLATGGATTSISAEGVYSVPVNNQFIRLQGGGADVYSLFISTTKSS